ncbi:MAG TPA: hypothetical protein VFO67_19250 [Gemmatimonadales bacterium]|nr:hypothetical protein [Gemmatimonadales bacterium]
MKRPEGVLCNSLCPLPVLGLTEATSKAGPDVPLWVSTWAQLPADAGIRTISAALAVNRISIEAILVEGPQPGHSTEAKQNSQRGKTLRWLTIVFYGRCTQYDRGTIADFAV